MLEKSSKAPDFSVCMAFKLCPLQTSTVTNAWNLKKKQKFILVALIPMQDYLTPTSGCPDDCLVFLKTLYNLLLSYRIWQIWQCSDLLGGFQRIWKPLKTCSQTVFNLILFNWRKRHKVVWNGVLETLFN